MKRNIPNVKITIDEEYSQGEDLGVSMVAFTKRPAILVKGMAFQSNTKPQYFNDDLKYRICAPVMIPMEIYRCDEDGEYTVTFTEEEIDKIHSKFMKNYTSTKIFNLEHNVENVAPAYILETWIVDKPMEDKSYTTFGIKVPKGTLMMTTQITDNEYYDELVANDQIGFSIEGFLGLKLSEIITKNKNEEKMAQNELMLPAGEYTDKDGNVFIVSEDGTITTKTEMGLEVTPEAEAQPEVSGTTETKLEKQTEEEVKMEEVVTEEEVNEEEMAEVPPTEEPTTETYSKEEVDAKFEELYKIIATMQSEDVLEDELELSSIEETKMSIHDRFSAFVNFSKKSI